MELIIGNSFTELKNTPNNIYLVIKEALMPTDYSIPSLGVLVYLNTYYIDLDFL